MLRGKGIGALVISEDGVAVEGIISERDILRGLAEHGAGVLAMTVTDVMTKEVVTCDPGDNVRELMKVMTARRFRHLPVVEYGALCGIISMGDLVKSRLEETGTRSPSHAGLHHHRLGGAATSGSDDARHELAAHGDAGVLPGKPMAMMPERP